MRTIPSQQSSLVGKPRQYHRHSVLQLEGRERSQLQAATTCLSWSCRYLSLPDLRRHYQKTMPREVPVKWGISIATNQSPKGKKSVCLCLGNAFHIFENKSTGWSLNHIFQVEDSCLVGRFCYVSVLWEIGAILKVTACIKRITSTSQRELETWSLTYK